MMLPAFLDQLSVRALVSASDECVITGVGELAHRFLARNRPKLVASWTTSPVASLSDPFAVELLHHGRSRKFQLFSFPCACESGCDWCSDLGELNFVGEKFQHSSGSIYVVTGLSIDAEPGTPMASRVLVSYRRQDQKFPTWTHHLENFKRPGRFLKLALP